MNPDWTAHAMYDRMLAYDGHTDMSPAMLLVMYSMNDTRLKFMALAHPNFPFKTRFIHELKTYPVEFKIVDMSCVTDRAEDYKKFLTDNQLTSDDIADVPRAWLIALLEK